MKISASIFRFTFLLALVSVAQARTDCPAAKVQNIQIEATRVIYLQEGSPWRTLGPLSDQGTKERLAALFMAQATGRAVVVGYISDAYNCSVEDYTTSAFMIRTY